MLVENRRQIFNGFGMWRGNSLFTKIFSYWALLLKLYELDYYGVGGNSSPVVFDFMLVTEIFCFYLGGVWIWIESSCKRRHHSLFLSPSLLCLMCVFTDLDSLLLPLLFLVDYILSFLNLYTWVLSIAHFLLFSFFSSLFLCVWQVLFVLYQRLQACIL